MEWLADRFFRSNGIWTDAASGATVRILIEDKSPIDAFDWEEQCARLSYVRHPLLNPLLDYGDASRDRRFEAYSELPPLMARGSADAIRHHAAQFLRYAGITVDGTRATFAKRTLVKTATFSPRALGVTLQPRSALAALQEMLESPAAAPTVASVIGPSSAGLRTLRTFVARSARLSGFIPVSAAVFVRHFSDSATLNRHFCVLDDGTAGAGDFASALVKLAAASARRHVVIRFRRLRSGRGGITLDPLSVRSMMGMVFVERGGGPTEQELFDAARLAEGRPGAFLAQLMAPRDPERSTILMVHEISPEYAVAAGAPVVSLASVPRGRTLQTALRARGRATRLTARGRHAAAGRLLLRASRVLEGRGRCEEAAACVLDAGVLARERGRTADAARLFERARELSDRGPVALAAAGGLAEAWIDDLRLVEAEALLRGTSAAADSLQDHAARVAATAGLVRCLNCQERASDAIAAAAALEWPDEDPGAIRLLVGLVRSHCAVGRSAAAIRLARRAEALSGASPERSAGIVAGLALAEALAAAGDGPGMSATLTTVRIRARQLHQPLAIIESHLIEHEHQAFGESNEFRQRSERRLRGLQQLRLPKLYLQRIANALKSLEDQKSSSTSSDDFHRGNARADALEALLHVSHQAQDERAAVTAICAATLGRVAAATIGIVAREDRRVLASEGRAWMSSTSLLAQALATGQSCCSQPGTEPREAVEPIRHGNEIIAAIACRWSAGTLADVGGASAILRAAALAAATPVRVLLDCTPAPAPPGAWGDLLGTSAAAETLRDAVTRAARAPFPVLIEGESGSGKELVARAIHRLGVRRDRRFCAVNCAALTDELVETELFGHARGAFTGAASERAGLFEEADGGTLFLDEVTELSPRAQAKLLRVLQEGEVRRIGENFPRRVDARIVAATNRSLAEEVPAGRFRTDLRFRLDVVRIVVPALRERPGDVPVLAAHFWSDASQRVGSRATLTPETLAALARYDWPGNVRELQNVIAWIAVHSPRRGRIGPSALPAHVAQSAVPTAHTFAAARDEFDRRFVRAALAGADGQMARAARALGMSRQGLSKMMRRLQIDPGTESSVSGNR